MSSSEVPDPDSESVAGEGYAILISDASREGEVIAEALRVKGFSVGELSAELLEARVLTEAPRAILVDIDQAGVLEAVEHLLQLSAGPPLEIFCLGDPMRAAEIGATRASGRAFARPIDIEGIVASVTRVVRPGPHAARGRPSSPPDPHRRTSMPPARRDSESPASPLAITSDPFDAAELLPELDRSRTSSRILPTDLSPELRQILEAAQRRVGTVHRSSSLPPPDHDLDLLLPPEMLAALDEPLDPEGDGSTGVGTMGTPIGRLRPGSIAPSTSVPHGTRTTEKTDTGFLIGPTDASEMRGMYPLSQGPIVEAHLGGRAIAAALAHSDPPPIPHFPTLAPPTEVPTRPLEEFAETAMERPTPAPPRPIANVVGAPPRAEPIAQAPSAFESPVLFTEGDALRALAKAIAGRGSGSLSLGAEPAVRRIVLHEGDIVTAGSSAPEETLLAFLVERGELSRGDAAALGSKFPAFGRHAGAALIAHGHLGQDDLWPVLRAHAEWIIGRAMLNDTGLVELEIEAPGRYKAEPGVFGGATGAEVLVEVVRRVIPPEAALRALGGPNATIAEGAHRSLLGECALSREDESMVRSSAGATVGSLLAEGPPDRADLLYALVVLGVLAVPIRGRRIAPAGPSAPDPLDEDALRNRVRARLLLVEDGDYFALLGVARGATSYEIRRAYLELRRSFEPGRVLTAATADLGPDLRVILDVLEEAYEILRDSPRRDRYRKAIEAGPP